MCIKKHIPTNKYYILLVYMFYITTKPNGKKRDDPKKRETESGMYIPFVSFQVLFGELRNRD